MIKAKTIKGLKVVYDYPAGSFSGIKIGKEYEVIVEDEKYFLVSLKEKLEFKEEEIRLFFKEVENK